LQYQIHERFFTQAQKMRAIFDQRFADPLNARADRFVWDYWHVPGQYTLLRTPAHAFFPPQLYAKFHRHLVEWGRENLGCHDVSPPWLSCYVEGCKQEIHSDVPHGPLAFVYSLTPTKSFAGGETFMLNERAAFSNTALERRDMVKTISPKFNRLVVFNPAVPHGVNEVRGTHDPRYGRLVIHGWFVNPRPFWYGPLSAKEIQKGVESGLGAVLSGDLKLGRGLLSLRLTVAASGRVTQVRPLISTLNGAQVGSLAVLNRTLKDLRFAKKRAPTKLTLPLLMS
jgi:hypothetical protein